MAQLDLTELFHAPYPDNVRPYIRLWSSVLYQGLKDAAKYMARAGARGTVSRRRVSGVTSEQASAFDWMWSDNQKPPSFAWICGVLDVEPETVRKYFYANWRNLVKQQKEEEKNED